MFGRIVLALGILVTTAAAQAAPPDRANTLTPQDRKAGWRLLFDGKTTKGWRGFKKPEPPAGWQVVDGVLTLAGKGGDIMTADEFADFDFQADWRIEAKGNSGIIYRATEDEDTPWKTGPEYQLLDDAGHPDAKEGKAGNRKAASLYDVYPPNKDVVKPPGEWNTARIVCKGTHIEHWLNGQKVLDADVGSDEWKKRIAESKWAKLSPTKFGVMPKGHIALQDHGHKIEFRNVKILDLSSPPKGAAKKAK